MVLMSVVDDVGYDVGVSGVNREKNGTSSNKLAVTLYESTVTLCLAVPGTDGVVVGVR